MKGSIHEFTRTECPICGHRNWCGRDDDGLVLCQRPPTAREVPGFAFNAVAIHIEQVQGTVDRCRSDRGCREASFVVDENRIQVL